jgi:menaquinone-specific isochorismate synthase
LEEHQYAADSVEEALRPLTSSLHRSTVRVLDFGEIHHLGTSYRGNLIPEVGALQATAALHPTAAVAGTPKLEALDFIARHERVERGRYAGPVGWVDGAGSGELAIAIRCGLVEPDSALLYSGVGVVAGSDPDEEWEESMLKMRPMLHSLA